jgi:alpha-beta hydrolase superfamily lysophospholipase
MRMTIADTLAGAVLSGSNGRPPAIALARWLARLERARVGPRGTSALMQSLVVARFDRPFRPTRTSADWLLCDPAEVDTYLDDPMCGGFQSTTQLCVDGLGALPHVASPARQARIPKSLPIDTPPSVTISRR